MVMPWILAQIYPASFRSNLISPIRSHLLLALSLGGGKRFFVVVTHSRSMSLWFYSLICTLEASVCPHGLQRELWL